MEEEGDSFSSHTGWFWVLLVVLVVSFFKCWEIIHINDSINITSSLSRVFIILYIKSYIWLIDILSIEMRN